MTSIAPRETTTFTDSLPDTSEELEAVVRAERKQLKASIEELGSAMRDKVDVRTQFREHPLASVGVGLVAGMALGVLSNRLTAKRENGSGAPNLLHSPPPRQTVTAASSERGSGALGTFGAALLGMIGPKIANLAEDTLRESLSRKRFSVPERR